MLEDNINDKGLDSYHQDNLNENRANEALFDPKKEDEPEIIENSQIEAQAKPDEQLKQLTEQAYHKPSHKIPVIGPIKKLTDDAALGVGDFLSDGIGLVPWLKPIDEWWDKNSPRSRHPANKLIRDASSVIIPSIVGSSWVIGAANKLTAARAITLPSFIKTLGSVSATAGVDTGVAMISSHSKKDDNLAGILNNWLGWNIPWGTRPGDDPDTRWKKNVFDAASLSAGAELLTTAFIFGNKARLFPRDSGAEEVIKANKISGEDLLTESILRSRGAKTGAQYDEMIEAIKADPTGTEYNAFVNDIGEDSAGKAVVNTEANPLEAKLHQAQIQSNIGTTHGRAVAVANDSFVKEFTKAIDGNERAQQLDVLFDQISPNFDAEVTNGPSLISVSAEQMNRSVDNLTTALFGQDISFNEFQTIVDDMKTVVFGSHEILDEAGWVAASQSFKNAYDTLFDPNQMRASAMLTQQAADTVSDTAAAAIMLGDEVDTTRQFQIMFEKLNLLDTEVKANKYISSKAAEYKEVIETGDPKIAIAWLNQQADHFDKYLKATKIQNNNFTKELIGVAKYNPQYFDALKEAFFASDGKVDELHKLHAWAEKNIGLIKKGVIDGDPSIPSLVVKGLHGVRINSVLSGLAAPRAVLGNSMMTAIKPISVFTGALAQGDMAVLKRASYTYGGITENLKRGFKVMANEWKMASSFPEAAMMRGRADLKLAKLDNFYALEDIAEGWRVDGENGKLAMWNMAKSLSWWNKQNFVKYGTNALYAIDGMTNSFMASGMARARAYDELLKNTNGAQFDEKFIELQRKLYDNAFDETGLLTDDAAKFASQEIALNLDNNTIKKFEEFLDYVPAARSLFLFSRTGINGFNLSWTFNPMSNLGPALSNARKVLSAKTAQQKTAALIEHGIDATQDADLAFNTLKSEYIGRQLMGSGVVMGAGLWALEGNITGAGPEDDGERRRMMSMGWQPYSIKNPITGEWRSYKGFEPFQSILAITADVVYQANRVDSSLTEDWFRKIGHAITMNVTNDTFIGGFEPLLGLISGDPSAWTRFWAGQTDTITPYKGLRTILSNAVTPQLKDVENDFFAYQRNAHKYFFRRGDQEDPLKDLLDIYTGEPIRYFEPIPAAFNAVLPMFKQNSDMEPWRQWLLSTGWDGLQRLRRNRDTRQPLNDADRYFVNNWVAKNGNLKSQILALMTEGDGYWNKLLADYKKLKGLQPQNDYPIRMLLLHKELDRIHDRVFEAAFDELALYNDQYTTIGREIRHRDYQLQRGNVSGARDSADNIRQLQQMKK